MRRNTILGMSAVFVLSIAVGAQEKQNSDKIPITTTSAEARQLYVKGRDLAEKLRATDARKFYEQAVEKDKNFALGYVGLANTSGTTKEFIDAVTRAASLAGGVSEGERHMIGGLEAGLKADPTGALKHFTELVRLFPNDERALTLLGNTHFGRQEYETAIKHYEKATGINASFSPPYNQLGYAYRFIERFDDAEKAFKKYTELIPGDPNPYDSYAELLLKVGRFDESIKMYEKALAIDPNSIASTSASATTTWPWARPKEARPAFAKIAAVARTTGERRTAHFWTAASYVHEGATDKAIAELQAGYALAETNGDAGTMSGDLTQMGDILREAGRPAEALAKVRRSRDRHQQVQGAGGSEGSHTADARVRRRTRGSHKGRHHHRARQARGIHAAGCAEESPVRSAAAARARRHDRARGEAVRAGSAGAEARQPAGSADSLPTALALQGAGDTQGAGKFAAKAAKFNGLNLNYGYVRNKARKLAGT